MSLKTLIVLCIFAGLIVTYLVYMAGEMSKSNKKIEAFQEASDAHRAAKAKESKAKAKGRERFEEEDAAEEAAADAEDEEDTTPPPRNPSRVLVTSAPTRALAGTSAPSGTATPSGTRSPVGTFGPTTTSTPSSAAVTSTAAPAGTPLPIGTLGPAATSAPSSRKDFEKSLFIVNKYEEIFGTKIGPEELEQLTAAFADIDDKEVIVYKMKEMKYKGVDEIDTIFQLADVSERLSNIVGKLKARTGALQNAPTMRPISSPTTFPPTMAAFATTLPPVSTTRAPLEAFSANRKFMPY
jgi:hypothetical protein